jgi:hypothetical protein
MNSAVILSSSARSHEWWLLESRRVGTDWGSLERQHIAVLQRLRTVHQSSESAS